MKEVVGKKANRMKTNEIETNVKEINGNETNVIEINEEETNGKETNGEKSNKGKTNRAGKRKGPLVPAFALVLALLCSLLFLCLPAVSVRMQDAAVLSRELPRPAEEGALAERAREIPLVYALYRRRYLVGPGYSTALEDDGTGEGTAHLKDRTSELAYAGVLPEETAQQIQALLSLTPMYAKCDTGGDISAAMQWCRTGQGNDLDVMLYWHTDTGCVVSFEAAVDASGIDTKELLCQYRAYLGVDMLDDWTDLELKDETRAACWSQAGQLYLYCYVREKELSFGAASLSLEEMTETFLQ